MEGSGPYKITKDPDPGGPKKHTDPDPQHCRVVIWTSPCDEQGLRKHHESRHVADKKFKCEECPKSYATRAMLKVSRFPSYTGVVETESNWNSTNRNFLPQWNRIALLSVPAPDPVREPDWDPNPT